MSRKKGICVALSLSLCFVVLILSLTCQKDKLNKRYNNTLSKYSKEVIELKKELKDKETELTKKELEMESFQIDFSGEDVYIISKFQPDGRIYNINAADIAFYPDPNLEGRLSEPFEFISDVSDPLEREDGVTVYGYLTTKGVVYSDMRVSLYACEN